MKKALIAMSGGVDSSVAAFLAQEQGYSCIGCTMKLYHNKEIGMPASRTCCSLDDIEAARDIAYKLDMPYYVFNFTDDFREKIIDKFVQSYEHGCTPNPCIDCNRYMKFDKLYQNAKMLDCECIVTGHYARIEYDNGRYLLKKALDETKDQSYVLYSLTQEQLAHTLFPLGTIQKTTVRQIAEKKGFCNAGKPDSQDICFVPDGNYVNFLQNYSQKKYPIGNFLGLDGKILGKHKGVICYTIGQRKGLGLTFGEPMYVNRIDTRNNTVTLGPEKALYRRTVIAEHFNWICEIPHTTLRCKAKIRYRQKEQPASVQVMHTGDVRLMFDEPQRAVTPGQAVVLYEKDFVLGGGIISEETGGFCL